MFLRQLDNAVTDLVHRSLLAMVKLLSGDFNRKVHHALVADVYNHGSGRSLPVKVGDTVSIGLRGGESIRTGRSNLSPLELLPAGRQAVQRKCKVSATFVVQRRVRRR
jgi:hypothetical protein